MVKRNKYNNIFTTAFKMGILMGY